MNEKTTGLFTMPSFTQGVGSLFDVWGTLNQYNTSDSDEEADYAALESDWEVIGDNIRQAMQTVVHEV